MPDHEPPVPATHLQTNLGNPEHLMDQARDLMTLPWSRFTAQDIELYCLHIEEMSKTYAFHFGRLRGPSPLQVTMYSGPRITLEHPEERTWIEWTGAVMSCWNARPLDPAIGGEYLWTLVSRIWKPNVVPAYLQKRARHITQWHVYLAGSPAEGER